MNWKVRLKNPIFWIMTICFILILILAMNNIDIDNATNMILKVLEKSSILVFGVIGYYTACVDKTKKGVKDSEFVKSKNSLDNGIELTQSEIEKLQKNNDNTEDIEITQKIVYTRDSMLKQEGNNDAI